MTGPGFEDLDLERMAEWLEPLASPTRLRLLRYLTRPHYLEEVAAQLGITRQAARKHLDKLVEIEVIERKPGVRESGPVTEYVINPQALFLIYDEFEKLGSLRRDAEAERLYRTLATPGDPTEHAGPAGPCLTIVRGLDTGLRQPLAGEDKRLWTIGRDERSDLPLAHDPYVSHRHAEVRLDGARFMLTDLSSTNGTRHNWRLMPRGSEVPLSHGDLVSVGKTILLFWDAP